MMMKGGLFEIVVDTFTDTTDVVSNYNQPGMYDLLIIDIVMPKMNGFELYEKVKEIDDKAKACFITAHEVYYESLRDLFPGFEVDRFMRKPIENEELLRKVLRLYNDVTHIQLPKYVIVDNLFMNLL